MSPRGPYDAKRLVRICHPSDFSEASEVAFAHALKLALVSAAELQIIHVSRHVTTDEADVHWTNFPGVRQTLARWGVLPLGAKAEEVAHSGCACPKFFEEETIPSNPCSITGRMRRFRIC